MKDFPHERFWSRVNKADGCWLWAGSTPGKGYGDFSWSGKGRRAHRLMWMLTNGPIPDGYLVCHHCDNRKCVNPDHLFLGTYLDNARDCIKKGRFVSIGAVARQQTHCKRGHPFTESNTGWRRGRRECRTCRKMTNQRYWKYWAGKRRA